MNKPDVKKIGKAGKNTGKSHVVLFAYAGNEVGNNKMRVIIDKETIRFAAAGKGPNFRSACAVRPKGTEIVYQGSLHQLLRMGLTPKDLGLGS